MDDITLFFESPGPNWHRLIPSIKTLIAYTNDGTIGCIHFRGYYYILDETKPEHEISQYEDKDRYLPQKCIMTVYKGYELYNGFLVEFYRRDIIEDPPAPPPKKERKPFDDEDESLYSFCPDDEQKLYFRVLCKFMNAEEYNAAKLSDT